MKRLSIKYLSIILILAQTSVLFADTLTFNNGQKITGKLININEVHEIDPNTGVTSEVIFKVENHLLKTISKELIVGKMNQTTLMFDKKSIYKITDDKGNIIFTNNKNLMSGKGLIKKLDERQKTLSPEEQIGLYLGGELLKILLLPFAFMCMIWILAFLGWSPGG